MLQAYNPLLENWTGGNACLSYKGYILTSVKDWKEQHHKLHVYDYDNEKQ